jgi:hypothetical protein
VNQQQIAKMEAKLTKLLKEHEGCERGQMGGAGSVELREELSVKEDEIERMNEEFSFEIQKYNTVFEALRRELSELRAYESIDLVEQIELLETEIVRLREENELNQIIIKQLRSDSTLSVLSPKRSNPYLQYPNNRFQY